MRIRILFLFVSAFSLFHAICVEAQFPVQTEFPTEGSYLSLPSLPGSTYFEPNADEKQKADDIDTPIVAAVKKVLAEDAAKKKAAEDAENAQAASEGRLPKDREMKAAWNNGIEFATKNKDFKLDLRIKN